MADQSSCAVKICGRPGFGRTKSVKVRMGLSELVTFEVWKRRSSSSTGLLSTEFRALTGAAVS